MKGLNLSGFRKISSDAKSTTLEHKDGHKIIVAHAKLGPKMREQLSSLPMHEPKIQKMADGGEVAQDSAPDSSSQQSQAPVTINIGQPQIPAQFINPNPGSLAVAQAPVHAAPPSSSIPSKGDAPYGVSPEQIAQMQEASSAAPTPVEEPKVAEAPVQQAPAAPSDPYGTQAYEDAYMKGLGEQKAGLMGEAQAISHEGEQQAKLLDSAVQKQQEAAQVYQKHYDALESERQRFQQAFEHQNIDPNHYLKSMSTGGKILSAIGLIAGGIGAGLTHTSNGALDFLNAQIDRDIQAQKANLGKTENLLNLNMKQFGNLKDATDMTRVMQMDVVSNQLKAAAAKAQSPLAQARLLQAAGKLDQEAAPVLSQISMRRTLLTGMQGGQIAPEQVVRMVVPQHEQAGAYKELQAAQNLGKGRDNLVGAFDQLKNLNTVGSRITSPIQTPKQVAAIRDPLLAQLVKDSEGRITPQDTEMIKPLFPAPGDNEQTLATKRAQLVKFVTEKMNFPLLRAYGINISNSGRFNNAGQSRIQEAPPVLPSAGR